MNIHVPKTSFSQGSSTDAPKVISNQTRRRHNARPRADRGGLYGRSAANSAENGTSSSVSGCARSVVLLATRCVLAVLSDTEGFIDFVTVMAVSGVVEVILMVVVRKVFQLSSLSASNSMLTSARRARAYVALLDGLIQ